MGSFPTRYTEVNKYLRKYIEHLEELSEVIFLLGIT